MKNPKPSDSPHPPVTSLSSPLERDERRRAGKQPPALLVVRTEKRSWLVVAITGFGAVILRYLRIVRRDGSRLWLLMTAITIVALIACYRPLVQKGGTATTTIRRPGQTNAVTLAQSENPREPSQQLVQSDQTIEYVLPPGTALPLTPETGWPGAAGRPRRLEANADPNLPVAPGLAFLDRSVPVRIVAKDRTETRIGGAQKDTLREWAGKAANLQPVLWAGIIMMTVVAGVFIYFRWWTKAGLAGAVGAAMIGLAQILPEHGSMILFGGLSSFAVLALLVLYAYHKGKLDQNDESPAHH